MNENNVKRIITCTSLGVGESYKDCNWSTKMVVNTFLKKIIADKNI